MQAQNYTFQLQKNIQFKIDSRTAFQCCRVLLTIPLLLLLLFLLYKNRKSLRCIIFQAGLIKWLNVTSRKKKVLQIEWHITFLFNIIFSSADILKFQSRRTVCEIDICYTFHTAWVNAEKKRKSSSELKANVYRWTASRVLRDSQETTFIFKSSSSPFCKNYPIKIFLSI